MAYEDDCDYHGCQLAKARDILATAQTYLDEQRKRMEPTQALWCEQGGHSFSSKDLGRKVITISGAEDQPDESRTVCGACASQAIPPRHQLTDTPARPQDWQAPQGSTYGQ